MATAEGAEGASGPDEEYMVWRKNTPFLYDLVISHGLEWPSLTVQWLPGTATGGASQSSSSSSSAQKLLLGTHTSDDSPNFLLVADVHFPSPFYEPPTKPVVETVQMIPHDGEVNRARYMPQNTSLVATKTCGSEVHVFDRSKWPIRPEEEGNGANGPDIVLTGHSMEGYGISWSPLKEGYLLSGSYDSRICLWDVSANPLQRNNLQAKDIFEAHEDMVEDVCWHLKNENLFGSVGDDRKLMIWDMRSTLKKPNQSVVAHEKEVNSLSFNTFNEWILTTASSDKTINLFDLRKLSTSLHTFSGHMEEVTQVDWSPNSETILASSAGDNRVMVWDICRIGDEQTSEDAEDGPPELLFVHGGHTAKISEFSWNHSKPWVISSVDEDNVLQVWQMAESIYRDDQLCSDN